jgi:hypothetical protein
MGAGGSVFDDEKISSPGPTKSAADRLPTIQEKAPEFTVHLHRWPGCLITLPDSFVVRLSSESLDFVSLENRLPLVQFPYQNIICWGQSNRSFQFKIFDLTKENPQERDNGVLIELRTAQGKVIADTTMSIVRKLMATMDSKSITKEEFLGLMGSVFHPDGTLQENWMETINQFTSGGRQFLAKQGMELLLRVGDQAPFDKVELACLIYERMVNKSSFQLIINTFEDPVERDNLIHRVKGMSKQAGSGLVSNCTILPERPLSTTADSSFSLTREAHKDR